MFFLHALTLVIGLFIIYAILGLAVKTIVMLLTDWFTPFTRRNFLYQALDNFLDGDIDHDRRKRFVAAFYEHPLVQMLSAKKGVKPTYIPPNVGGQAVEAILTSSRNAPYPITATEYSTLVEYLPNSPLKELLRIFMTQSNGNPESFRETLETHFKTVTARAYDRHKQHVNTATLFVSLYLVVLINADAFEIAASLSRWVDANNALPYVHFGWWPTSVYSWADTTNKAIGLLISALAVFFAATLSLDGLKKIIPQGAQRLFQAAPRTAPVPDHPETPAPRRAEGSPGNDANGPTIKEAALLYSLTEKLYGSWAFRIVAGSLVAAAFLAGTGTLLIGDKTLQLTESLQTAADHAKSDIKTAQKEAQGSMGERLNAVKKRANDFKSDIKKLGDDTKNGLQDAKEKANAAIKKFNEDSTGLRNEAVKQIVGDIKHDLGSKTSDINEEINGVRSNVEKLKKSAGELKDELAGLTVVREQRAAVEKSVKNQSNQLDEVDSRIASVESRSVDVQSQLDKLNRDSLTPLGSSIDNLNKSIESIDKDIPGIKTRLENAKMIVAGIESEAEKLKPRPPEPSKKLQEGGLTTTQWYQIQRALNDRGYVAGTPDGRPDRKDGRQSRTRKAISKFQRSRPDYKGPDGVLSAEQIEELLGHQH